MTTTCKACHATVPVIDGKLGKHWIDVPSHCIQTQDVCPASGTAQPQDDLPPGGTPQHFNTGMIHEKHILRHQPTHVCYPKLDGEFVLYADHLQELESLRTTLTATAKERDALASEISGLRSYHKWAEAELEVKALTVKKLSKERDEARGIAMGNDDLAGKLRDELNNARADTRQALLLRDAEMERRVEAESQRDAARAECAALREDASLLDRIDAEPDGEFVIRHPAITAVAKKGSARDCIKSALAAIAAARGTGEKK